MVAENCKRLYMEFSPGWNKFAARINLLGQLRTVVLEPYNKNRFDFWVLLMCRIFRRI